MNAGDDAIVANARWLADFMTLAGFASSMWPTRWDHRGRLYIAIACNSHCLIIFHWLCVSSVFSSIPLFWTWIFFWVLFGALSEANLMRLDPKSICARNSQYTFDGAEVFPSTAMKVWPNCSFKNPMPPSWSTVVRRVRVLVGLAKKHPMCFMVLSPQVPVHLPAGWRRVESKVPGGRLQIWGGRGVTCWLMI